MKRYEIYRHIRRKALIYGLPVGMFALMMLSVIGSLLMIIFSFGFSIILLAVLWNLGLYASLGRLNQNPQLLNYRRVFPKMISNKKITDLNYED
ncbi:hypothetical protein OQ279_13105 [Salinimicrobium sp. MT39]|uniref:Type IV secretory pathway, VirB3-like protein n=1 Tax=Salinimicrobium profundisediminis TaxID=2994553 RepID=A0A9X3CYT2_9FLAO|nr:hypothetical protein [Salinimicrobium profundisediminis]MCX2839088.1 hypothetical protein [Salinimicrobium profundisediminis]